MDESGGIPWTKWCVGGKTNIVLNCIDRHKDKELFNDTFIFSEKENGDTSTISYKEYIGSRPSNSHALKTNGFVKGDVIALYMPQIIETYIAYFAILKIGCVVLPLFSGYGSNAVVDRLRIAKAKGIFTSSIKLKMTTTEIFDSLWSEYSERTPSAQKINELFISKGNKIFNWDNFQNTSIQLKTEEMEAEDPAIIHFTSGTTGKPKGCVYTHIGLVTKMSFDEGVLADFKQTDIHFCMADMGWMVGVNVIQGAALAGAKMIIAEGVPDFPDEVRFWKLIEKYKVSWVELSPALIRIQMLKDKKLFEKLDLSSLRIVCTGGEPWTEKPWKWLFEFIGKSKVN